MKLQISIRSVEMFSPLDWNFDNVPDDELAVCRLWEYARESETIRKIWQQSVSAAFDNTMPKEKRDAIRKEFYQLFNGLGRASILFQAGIYGFGGKNQYENFHSPFPQPWQELSKEQRHILMETAAWNVRYDCPTPGFMRAHHAYIHALAKLYHPKSMKEVFGRDGGIGVTEFYHAGKKLRAICPNLMCAGGTEILLVEIEWGEFTNEELVKDFAQWLKENEPEGVQRPDRRGHKNRDMRVALDRLGMMRLLHRFTLRELPVKCADAEKAFHGYEWYKERRRAGKVFHELFPFLPKAETPISWPTKGGRSR
ncbi:MAG: hypothetical protein WBN75_16020 [Verrucomicrobiia bacterium]